MSERSRRARNTALWVVAGGVVLIGGIIIVSAVAENKSGSPVIENPGALLGVAVTAFGGLMAAILPIMLSVEKSSESTKTGLASVVDQVENNHRNKDGSPLNLRDDLDSKHSQIIEKIDILQSGVHLAIDLSRANAEDIRGIRRDVGRSQDAVARNTESLHNLALTTSGLIRTVDTLGRRTQSARTKGDL